MSFPVAEPVFAEPIAELCIEPTHATGVRRSQPRVFVAVGAAKGATTVAAESVNDALRRSESRRPLVASIRTVPVSRLGAEFNDFLFAQIGNDASGRPLSVVSALARLDIDPWAEASALSLLPLDLAAQRLTLLFSQLPVGPALGVWRPETADLIALLPRHPPRADRGGPAIGEASARVRGVMGVLWWLFLGFMAVGIILNRPPAPNAAAPAAIASAASTRPASMGVDH